MWELLRFARENGGFGETEIGLYTEMLWPESLVSA
jgi:hypothetical protein